MSTPAQLTANQANAQSSTGPRTPEGKAASSANATKHGFYGKHAVLLNDQERTQFESLRNSYVYVLNPTNIVEVALLDLLALAAWNIERTNRLEAEIANTEGIDPLLSETSARKPLIASSPSAPAPNAHFTSPTKSSAPSNPPLGPSPYQPRSNSAERTQIRHPLQPNLRQPHRQNWPK